MAPSSTKSSLERYLSILSLSLSLSLSLTFLYCYHRFLLQALKGGLREKVELATKFGVKVVDGKREIRGDPAYVREACEASLKRLDVDCIDLYYQHRIDTRVPIELTVSFKLILTSSISIIYIHHHIYMYFTLIYINCSFQHNKERWIKNLEI